MMQPEWFCSACLYVQPRPDLDDDAKSELEVLTVVDGQLLCLRHVGCASTNHHNVLMAAVALESRGEFNHLNEYQAWHYKQSQQNGDQQ